MTAMRAATTVLLLLSAAAPGQRPPSYSRDIAPVLAFECNRCHGDEGVAGGADTRTHESVRRTVNLELLMDLLEGRRGEERRMPREAPPLSAPVLALFRRWIAEGAPGDVAPDLRYRLTKPLSKSARIRIGVTVPSKAYVVIELTRPDGTPLHREAAVVTTERIWEIRSAAAWPRRLTVVATVWYGPPGAVLFEAARVPSAGATSSAG
jgi:hypothetical protein